ncbi:hypothetical protein THAOC_10339 [Thalassiosira oceanica]|uniref:Methyltransferase FkbM domain-containing protein n=1 Tax=Thalassiosira oceanica TaxID=159749 RepID=K0TD85_THAOC|nr:hypothetical protein THAOC_10339 [Thalassiosira oceanica]|mmetsp:Transcript_3671/g.8239  ORF Transcript_3671/g.8239 Transcript_3671/m.8239 type:complete len:338 (+) Transcript_3671:542-1555(+)|eukprot:EJK68477.1 hypothetical protein THAOC_10339 [Thalassiosira oceanica]
MRRRLGHGSRDFVSFLVGVIVGAGMILSGVVNIRQHMGANGSAAALYGGYDEHPDVQVSHASSWEQPQVYSFIKDLGCRKGHMDVPPILTSNGNGKVVVDIGLDAGDEFFAALEAGYSVYGIEANPLTVSKLRPKCENATNFKCIYINAANITDDGLPLIKDGGYLIEGGAGSARGVINMSLSGPGSSFVEVAPDIQARNLTPTYKEVTVIPLENIVKTDVFFFKLDVQGYEFEVLKGSKQLFLDYKVKTILMEFYPRGLLAAKVNLTEFLNFLWDDLGMMCSSSNAGEKSFMSNHPNTFDKFAQYVQRLGELANGSGWWGTFDDFFCFNRKKTWHE